MRKLRQNGAQTSHLKLLAFYDSMFATIAMAIAAFGNGKAGKVSSITCTNYTAVSYKPVHISVARSVTNSFDVTKTQILTIYLEHIYVHLVNYADIS